MSDYGEAQSPRPEEERPVDSLQMQFALDRLRSQQNLIGALVAGAASASVGAGLWALITVVTEYQIGWMAVGVGFLVGFSVRAVVRGIDPIFNVIGAVFALVGCAAGNLLAVCGIVAVHQELAFTDVLMGLDFNVAKDLMVATFSPMDLAFYGFAIFEGYKLSTREVDASEIDALTTGPTGPA